MTFLFLIFSAVCFYWKTTQKTLIWNFLRFWVRVFPFCWLFFLNHLVIGGFVQEEFANVIKYLALWAQNGTLRMRPIRRIFLCAGCFFFFKVLIDIYLTKKQFAPFSNFWYGLSFCWLVFPCNILSQSISLKLLWCFFPSTFRFAASFSVWTTSPKKQHDSKFS